MVRRRRRDVEGVRALFESWAGSLTFWVLDFSCAAGLTCGAGAGAGTVGVCDCVLFQREASRYPLVVCHVSIVSYAYQRSF